MPSQYSIALPVPLRQTFDYLADDFLPELAVGARVRVPFGRGDSRTLVGFVVDKPELGSANGEHKLKPILEAIDQQAIIPTEILDLCHWVSRYYHHSLGETLAAAVPKKIRQGEPVALPSEKQWRLTTKAKGLAENSLKNAKKQRLVLDLLIENQGQLAEETLKQHAITKAVLKQLADKELIEAQELPASKPIEKPFAHSSPHPLTEEQQQALLELDRPGFSVSLIDGITGSGKTELYLQKIAEVIERGQQALILIPEISLSPQTIARFQQRFEALVVALHSNLSDGERALHWQQARLGHADIVIGTRSAIFTPMPNLGLIVIDEEHDLSFKQQDGLRYSARDLALVRAQKSAIPVLLGSATPALESLNNAINSRYQHIRLRHRPGTATPSIVELHNILGQELQEGLCEHSLTELRSTLDNGQQALIFINRRGFAPNLLCHDCGWQAQCPHCDTNLTVHHNPHHLRCHHCDYQKPLIKQCPQCFGRQLLHLGAGTAKVEQFLAQQFPDTPVIRVDRDSTQKKHAFQSLLEPVHAGEPCILVGTQMLVKGHHFPNVTLVVVPEADAGLFGSDFRASERTGQQLLQVAGRAGRAELPGKVIIQTHHADHPLFEALFNGDYHDFARLLLEERQLSQMPPFSHLAVVRAESTNPMEAQDFLTMVRNQLEAIAASSPEQQYLGPMPAIMERVNKRYRYFIQITSHNRSQMHATLSQITSQIDKQRLGRSLRWSLDVDPQEIP